MFKLSTIGCCLSVQSRADETWAQQRVGQINASWRLKLGLMGDDSYIKELAERLHTLENQMQPGIVQSDVPYQSMNEVSLPRAYQDFASPVDSGSANRKRTYSVFEGLPSSSFAQPSFNARGSQSAFDATDSTADPYNTAVASGSAPKPGNLFWNPTGHEQDLPSGLEMADLHKHEGDDDMSPVILDEGALDAYVSCRKCGLSLEIFTKILQVLPKSAHYSANSSSHQGANLGASPPVQP